MRAKSTITAFFALALFSFVAIQPTSGQRLPVRPHPQVPDGPPKSEQARPQAPTSLLEIASGSKRSIAQSNGHGPSRRGFVDGTEGLKRLQEKRGERLSLQAMQNTIPFWSDSFTYQGLEFKYKMVGTDPKNGSRTTVIPTVIIPLRFVFPDGHVFDASTDIVDGQTPIQGIINSPIFQNYHFILGGTDVGNTQYGDAFQRANFWDSVSTRGRNYHVLLGQPTVLPTQTIIVPAGMGTYYYDPFVGDTLPLVNENFLNSQEYSIRASLNLSPRSLAITVWGSVLGEDPSFPGFPAAGGWHGAQSSNGGVLTYIGTSYFPDLEIDPRGDDIYSLSHEIAEWMDDPFIDNFTPGWNIPFIEPRERCDSGWIIRGLLEVGDPVAFFTDAVVALPSSGFTYHVTEAMFIDFFTRSARSRSVNGQYSMFTMGAPFGLPSEPSTQCIGSVQAAEQYIDFPGSIRTEARGINNHNEVVGFYVDQRPSYRGFVWANGSFSALDFPGAIGTVPSKINDSGEVVGYFFDTSGTPHGFSYTKGRWTRIDFPGSADSLALGINSAGDIVGEFDHNQPITHGFVLRNGQFAKVDTPFGEQSSLRGINDAGTLAGYTWSDPFNGPYFGVLSRNNEFSLINMPGATFTLPNSVNNGSLVTGTFINGNENYASGFVRLFGYLHEVNAGLSVTYVSDGNDHNRIVGRAFDFSRSRWVGYIGDLPITKSR